MIIDSVTLENFRNYSKEAFEFSPQKTLVVGPNTSGKTNLLEAIFLLATGKSFRAGRDEEMIRQEAGLSRITGQVRSNDEERVGLEIVLTRGEIGGEKVAKKKYLVGGRPKRMVDFVGSLRVTFFGPEDLNLVTDSPSLRRNYLDTALSQVDREYRRTLLSYEKGLRQRNKLLEQIREGEAGREQLHFWDRLLVKDGDVISQKRAELLDFISQKESEIGDLRLDYRRSVISESRLEKYAEEEVAAGATLVGPHRDDFAFHLDGKSLHEFGSRGEQRLAVFLLKLAELAYVEEKTEAPPVLLLDDIFSELDREHRKQVIAAIPGKQTIITTTDLGVVDKEFWENAETISLGE